MDAWSSLPIPSEYLKNRTALERRGALVFQAKQCHNCHSLDRARRKARTRSRPGRVTPQRRSTDSPGDTGRRQHACLRKESESGGNNRPGCISQDPCIRLDKRRPMTPRAPSRSEQVRSRLRSRRAREYGLVHVDRLPRTYPALVCSTAAHDCSGTCGIGLLARLGSSSKGFATLDFALAGCCFHG